MKVKHLLVGFVLSWIYATLLFHPQHVGTNLLSTAIVSLVYGFTWIAPITLIFLGLTRNIAVVQNTITHRVFSIGLALVALGALLVSLTNRYSNDALLAGFWVLTTLVWISTYLHMKKRDARK